MILVIVDFFPHILTTEGLREFPQLPSFNAKSELLDVNKLEKHFKMSHKWQTLARIYFSITDKVDRSGVLGVE
jgi:hypothetical protein